MGEHECACGFSAENAQGLSAHQRFCDEYDADDSSDSADTPTTVSTRPEGASESSTPGLSEFEDAVMQRDEYHCVRCGTDVSLKVHLVYPARDEVVSNAVTICGPCEEDVGDLHPVVKEHRIRQ